MNFRDKKFLLDLGFRIKEIRKSKKLSQEDLAYEQNISLSQIARIETGKLNPTICTLKKIADGLSIDVFELLKFETGQFQKLD